MAIFGNGWGNLLEEQEKATEQVVNMWIEDAAGHRIEIEDFNYRTARQTAMPMYTLGSPMPMDFPGPMSITGSFLLPIDDYHTLADMEYFQIYIETTTQKLEFHHASLVDYRFSNSLNDVKVTFLALTIEIHKSPPNLGSLTNKELAKFVLTQEY